MLYLKTACETSTAHGLPHIVSNKPVYVRVLWLLLFLLFLALFLNGLVGFVAKLQSRQVTSSLEASSVKFQFPDVYACFESPVSGTYSASMSTEVANEMNARLNDTAAQFEQIVRAGMPNDSSISEETMRMLIQMEMDQYNRSEQSVLSSFVSHLNNNGFLVETPIDFTDFFHPSYLRCFRWSPSKSIKDAEQSDLVLTLFIDGNDTSTPKINGSGLVDSPTRVYYRNSKGIDVNHSIPISEWSLFPTDTNRADRRSGVRVFLVAPGQYPTDFERSFLVGPGQHHLVEISMSETMYKPDQFDCLDNPSVVQFVNPYNESPYSHEYSYSYCYYYEYHKQFQGLQNLSGPASPLPWPLRGPKFVLNITGVPNMLQILVRSSGATSASTSPEPNYDQVAQLACTRRDRCSKMDYKSRISSAPWPTSASLVPFIGTVVAQARDSAAIKGLKVPALDFLVDSNASNSGAVAAYASANLVKLQLKPSGIRCDRVVFSIDYGPANFVADIGGIMGIYLGMSLLTICELLELLIDVVRLRGHATGKVSTGSTSATDNS